MELTFRVRPLATTGSFPISFQEAQMTDSFGQPIDFEGPESVQVEILEGIGEVKLEGTSAPGGAITMNVTEGDPMPVSALIYASGVDDPSDQAERITAWIGVHSENSDPSTWQESQWIEATWVEKADSRARFEVDAADRRDPGLWFVAARASLDGGPFFYGGSGGFWNGAAHPSGELTVDPLPTFRYTLAEWRFDEAGLRPARSTADNDTVRIRVRSAEEPDDPPETHDASGRTWLNVRGWSPQPGETPAISFTLSTRHFGELEFSSSHTGSGSGPARFRVQVSPDGEQWDDLPGGEIDLADQSQVHLQNLPLPASLEDRDQVHIRWLMTSGDRIDGSALPISQAGIHRIADIRLSGVNLDPKRVSVLPGDANGDGTVNAQDVLLLGHHWLNHGPRPAYEFIEFLPRQVEEWIPGSATHADTNGDGVVDHRDLLAVGLNFGRSAEPAPQQLASVDPAAILRLPQLEEGEELLLSLRSHRRHYLKGAALRMRIEGIAESAWSFVSESVPEWAEQWLEEDRLLAFGKRDGSSFEQAWSLQGRRDSVEAAVSAAVVIRALESWESQAEAILEWAVLSDGGGLVEPLEEIELLSGEAPVPPHSVSPHGATLYQNYPNPFGAGTVIRYHLSERQEVRLELFDMVGRRVALIEEGEREPGYHTIVFQPASLASGVYFYRLRTDRVSLTRKMLRIGT